eukprot:3354377-Pyramimonas_sp.AAC.1
MCLIGPSCENTHRGGLELLRDALHGDVARACDQNCGPRGHPIGNDVEDGGGLAGARGALDLLQREL